MYIEFKKEAWEKINIYIDKADGEISGLGIAKFDKENQKLIVRDIRIWDQECTSCWTEVVDNDAMLELVDKLIKEKVPMEDINIWWHSHADLGVDFSSTDEETIENWINTRFITAIVGNKKGEFDAMIAIKEPFRHIMKKVLVTTEPSYYDEKLVKKIEKEVEKKVKPKEYKKYGNNYYHDDDEPKIDKKLKTQNYLIFQESIKALSPREKKDFLLQSARSCGCPECLDYIVGDIKKFPFRTHWFDFSDNFWLTMAIPA